jgi:succinate-semialdehyde dehydrogenase/glutarate-semialdehyde dehydrogenase
MKEEIFGPVAMVFKADNIDEAIRIANDVPYGLGSSVWTKDPGEKVRFAQEIEAGMTAFNQILASTPEAPFGGIKHSGHGRELGSLGLYEFMNAKTLISSPDSETLRPSADRGDIPSSGMNCGDLLASQHVVFTQ